MADSQNPTICDVVNPTTARALPAKRHNQDTRQTITIELGECFIGDISMGDTRDFAIEGLPSTLELRTARYVHSRAQGLVELKIGAHSYLLNAKQIIEALRTLEA